MPGHAQNMVLECRLGGPRLAMLAKLAGLDASLQQPNFPLSARAAR